MPLPVLRATVIPSPFFHTLSGRPSELMSIRLYSPRFLEVNETKASGEAARSPCCIPYIFSSVHPSLLRHLAKYYNERLLPPCMRSSPQTNRFSESIAKIQSYLLYLKALVRKSIAININERFSFIRILRCTAGNGELGQPRSLLVQY